MKPQMPVGIPTTKHGLEKAGWTNKVIWFEGDREVIGIQDIKSTTVTGSETLLCCRQACMQPAGTGADGLEAQ